MTRYQIFCTSDMVCCDCVLIVSFQLSFPVGRHLFSPTIGQLVEIIPYLMANVKREEKKNRFFPVKNGSSFSRHFSGKNGKNRYFRRELRGITEKNSHIIRRKQRESNTPCRLVAESRTGFGRTGKKLLLPVTSFKSYCEYTEIVGCSRRFLSWIFFKNQIRKLCRIHAPALPHSFGEKQPAVAPVAVVVVDN